MANSYPLLSQADRAPVERCPNCGSTDIRGPHDTGRSATFLFTRAWFCRQCWWDKEARFKDDIAEAKAKQEARRLRTEAERARKGRR